MDENVNIAGLLAAVKASTLSAEEALESFRAFSRCGLSEAEACESALTALLIAKAVEEQYERQ